MIQLALLSEKQSEFMSLECSAQMPNRFEKRQERKMAWNQWNIWSWYVARTLVNKIEDCD